MSWSTAMKSAWRTILRCCQQVGNKLATSHCNGLWETTRYGRHNGLLPAPTCSEFATGKLQGKWWNGFWENLL